jgi:hypothetical protein
MRVIGSGLGLGVGSTKARALDSGRGVTVITRSRHLGSGLRSVSVGGESDVVITNLLGLRMDRAMICLLDFGVALIVRSKIVRGTSGVAMIATLVIPHICHSEMCNDESDEVKMIGANGWDKQQTLGRWS